MTASETWTNGEDRVTITLKYNSPADHGYRMKQLNLLYQKLIELGYYRVDHQGNRI